MLKNDLWISEQASLGMLEPFQEKLIRHLEPESKKSPEPIQFVIGVEKKVGDELIYGFGIIEKY